MLEKQLIDFGLTKNEAKTYLAALELEQALASTLSRKTGINRSSVYMIITSLRKKGLMGVFKKNGIDYFCAADPEILSIKEEHILNLQKGRVEQVHDLIERLNSLQKTVFGLPKVRFYEGLDGIKQVYEDTLKEGKTIYAIESVEAMPKTIQDYIFQNYISRRVKLGIFAYVISSNSAEGRQFKSKDKFCNRETILVDSKKYPFHMEINIYGDKVGFMAYEEEKYMGIIVENTQIAASMKSFFQLTWDLFKEKT